MIAELIDLLVVGIIYLIGFLIVLGPIYLALKISNKYTRKYLDLDDPFKKNRNPKNVIVFVVVVFLIVLILNFLPNMSNSATKDAYLDAGRGMELRNGRLQIPVVVTYLYSLSALGRKWPSSQSLPRTVSY